jgi:8-oxo-dGTP diphosphatase
LRELKEETGISEVSCLLQTGAYGDPKRDPRGRVVAIAYMATLAGDGRAPKAGSDAEYAEWHPVDLPPDGMAFDHPTIIGDALRRLTLGGRTGGILFSFLPLNFTSEQLAVVLKAVYGARIDPMTYLKSFIDGQVVKQSKDKKKFHFVGWHKGMCR